MKGRDLGHYVGHYVVESLVCQVKKKPKPHLHIKNCFMLYPRAGSLALLVCVCVPGLVCPVCAWIEKEDAKPFPNGAVISTAISDGPVLPQTLCWEERLLK